MGFRGVQTPKLDMKLGVFAFFGGESGWPALHSQRLRNTGY